MIIKMKGKYDEAIIYTGNVEEEALKQIQEFLDHEASEGANTRIMPDVHAGKGAVIGYTAKVTNKIIPNVVGVDIGCGVTAVRLNKKIEDLEGFDEKAHKRIPTGFNIHKTSDNNVESFVSENFEVREGFFEDLKRISKTTNQDYKKVLASIGTMGGGNHFSEMGIDGEGKYWLIVHSGSRNFGYRVADYWQKIAEGKMKDYSQEIAYIKENYSGKEIERRIKELSKKKIIKNDLAYLEGEDLKGYLRDASVAQEYAELNRKVIIHRLLFDFDEYDKMVQSTHNYIENGIIRKGAISAYEGEEVIIPLNMRDGCIFGIGKGNEDYNYSAPHGAGRKMSRKKASNTLSLEEFKETMEGVYSTCVGESTLDEAPMAYKDKEDIIDNIHDTVEIKEIIKPIWNFKSK